MVVRKAPKPAEPPATVPRTPTIELRSSCSKMSARRSTRHAGDLTTPEVSKIAHSTPPHSPHHRLLVGNPSGQGPPLVDLLIPRGGRGKPQRASSPAPRRRASRSRQGPGDERTVPLPAGVHANKNTRHRLTVGPRGPAGTHEHPRLSPAPGSAAPRSAGTARTATSGHQRQKASGHIVVMHNSDATPVVPSKMSHRGDDTGRASHRGPPPAHLTRDPTT